MTSTRTKHFCNPWCQNSEDKFHIETRRQSVGITPGKFKKQAENCEPVSGRNVSRSNFYFYAVRGGTVQRTFTVWL